MMAMGWTQLRRLLKWKSTLEAMTNQIPMMRIALTWFQSDQKSMNTYITACESPNLSTEWLHSKRRKFIDQLLTPTSSSSRSVSGISYRDMHLLVIEPRLSERMKTWLLLTSLSFFLRSKARLTQTPNLSPNHVWWLDKTSSSEEHIEIPTLISKDWTRANRRPTCFLKLRIRFTQQMSLWIWVITLRRGLPTH